MLSEAPKIQKFPGKRVSSTRAKCAHNCKCHTHMGCLPSPWPLEISWLQLWHCFWNLYCDQMACIILDIMWTFLCSHFLYRNRETKRDDFVFFTNRLACLIIEYALSFLSFKARACVYLHDQFTLMHAELSLHCLCQHAGRECGNTSGEHLWGEEIWWKGTCVCCRWTNSSLH